MKYKQVKRLSSKSFGGWEMRMNGLQQTGMSAKEFLKKCTTTTAITRQPLSKEDAKRVLNRTINNQCWYSDNGKYKVVVNVLSEGDGFCHDKFFEGTVWLSIRINNGDDYLCDWREFQQIKNELCGEEYCGIEFYPPESRMVDTVNVFHIWVMPKGKDIPLGYAYRDVSFDQEPNQRKENQ